MLGEPIAYTPDRLVGIVGVSLDVLAAHVRQGHIVAVSLDFEDQRLLASVPALAEQPCAK
jgi:hypothetical protein